MPNPSDGFRMPTHIVDQYAAALRDSGLPPPIVRATVSTVCMVLNQLAESLETFAPLLTGQDAAALVRDFTTGWDQMKETL